jgi:uncharacterized protein YuzE
MRVDVSKRAIIFVRSDEAVARTVASGAGILLDLSEDGRVIAIEVHEQGDHNLTELVAKHPDLEDFLDEIRRTSDELEQARSAKLSRKQSRRLHDAVRDFAGNHAHA